MSGNQGNDRNTKPLISVCVPTFNYARFLSVCIESVLRQTLKDWELVICDDRSTDETCELVRRFSAMDSRIRYILNDRQLGMNPNLRKVAFEGRGKYLKILCSDDWLTPTCLEEFCGLMERNPRVVLATSAEIHTDTIGEPLGIQFVYGKPITISPGESMLDKMALGSGFGGNSSFFIRASTYKKIGGYNEKLLYAGDFELAARLCRVGDYLHTNEPLFYGRAHPDSSSSLDPLKLYDVRDYYEIPSLVFQPRRFGNREWFRFEIYTARITSRYVINMFLEFWRGHGEYASALAKIIRARGNFFFGLLWIPFHVSLRLYNRLTRKKRGLVPLSSPIEFQLRKSSNSASPQKRTKQ